MNAPVPLIRRFTKIADTSRTGVDLDEAWLSHARGERLDWGHLRDQFRAVILAEAGAGKTFELRAEAERLRDRGRTAFFIRIEDIDADFENAFAVGTRASFDRWLNGTDEAWFFLDSVDEVRLETPRAFEIAMRLFATRVRDGRQRAHVIISSRPYAWRSALDGALIDELLPYAPIRVEPSGDEGNSGSKRSTPEADRTVQLYQLAPLDRDQIRGFAGHRGVPNVEAFLDALERHSLYGLAQFPFDLEDLIAIWDHTGALDSRLAVLEQGLRLHLGSSGAAASVLSLDRALNGARRLALAMTLLGESNIRLPGGAGSGVDASALLIDWSPEEVRELLSRGVFSDAIYSMVRFRHRETRELLASQEFAEALRLPDARPRVEGLIFREIYGEEVVVPRLRPLLPWVILFDAAIRDRALALQPEIAIEGGDPARLPLSTRITFLHDIVAGIVSKANRGGDNSQIARIAQPDLEDAVLDLLDAHVADDAAVFFLGRLAWQGNMREAARRLGSVARDPKRGIYARVASVRAIMSIGEADQRDALWTALRACAEPLPRRLLAEVIDDALADMHSVENIISLLERLEPHAPFTATGLTQALHNFIDRLPMMSPHATVRPLEHLVTGVSAYLFREPFIHQGSECHVSQEYSWLMAPALHAVERLIIGRSEASLGSPALDILTQAFALRHYGGFEDHDYKTKAGELVPSWIELNDSLFWHAVTQAKALRGSKAEPVTEYWHVEWLGHFWQFDRASFARTLGWIGTREAIEDRLLSLSRSFWTYVQNDRPRRWRHALWRTVRGNPTLEAKLRVLMRPPPDPDRRRWRTDESRWTRQRRKREKAEARDRARFVSRLKANPENVREPPGLASGEMSQGQLHLFDSIRGDGAHFTRGGGGNWRALVPEFGEAVAQAYRDAALRLWRAYTPKLRSEGADGSSIPYVLVFAMAGLEIEAGPDGQGLTALNDADAQQAMRYVFWEINGFPEWFEPLFRSYRELALEMVRGEVRWEIASSLPDRPMHYMLHNFVYHAPWLLNDIAESVRSWLMEHGTSNADVLRHARTIMVGGDLAPEVIAALARSRVNSANTPEAQLPTWLGMWVDADPTPGMDALEAKLSTLEHASATAFTENFICALTGDQTGGKATTGCWRSVEHIHRLYIMMHLHVRVAEDTSHDDGRAYTPTARDHAQRAREQLFNILADTPGKRAYDAIQDLAHRHPEVEYRAYMRRAARDRATKDSECLWSEQEVCDLINSLSVAH